MKKVVRILLIAILCIFLLVVGIFLSIPSFIGVAPVKKALIREINKNTEWPISFDTISCNWFSGITIENFQAHNQNNTLSLDCTSIEYQQPLYMLLFQGTFRGNLVVNNPVITIGEKQHESIPKQTIPLPQMKQEHDTLFSIAVKDGTFIVDDEIISFSVEALLDNDNNALFSAIANSLNKNISLEIISKLENEQHLFQKKYSDFIKNISVDIKATDFPTKIFDSFISICTEKNSRIFSSLFGKSYSVSFAQKSSEEKSTTELQVASPEVNIALDLEKVQDTLIFKQPALFNWNITPEFISELALFLNKKNNADFTLKKPVSLLGSIQNEDKNRYTTSLNLMHPFTLIRNGSTKELNVDFSLNGFFEPLSKNNSFQMQLVSSLGNKQAILKAVTEDSYEKPFGFHCIFNGSLGAPCSFFLDKEEDSLEEVLGKNITGSIDIERIGTLFKGQVKALSDTFTYETDLEIGAKITLKNVHSTYMQQKPINVPFFGTKGALSSTSFQLKIPFLEINKSLEEIELQKGTLHFGDATSFTSETNTISFKNLGIDFDKNPHNNLNATITGMIALKEATTVPKYLNVDVKANYSHPEKNISFFNIEKALFKADHGTFSAKDIYYFPYEEKVVVDTPIIGTYKIKEPFIKNNTSFFETGSEVRCSIPSFNYSFKKKNDSPISLLIEAPHLLIATKESKNTYSLFIPILFDPSNEKIQIDTMLTNPSKKEILQATHIIHLPIKSAWWENSFSTQGLFKEFPIELLEYFPFTSSKEVLTWDMALNKNYSKQSYIHVTTKAFELKADLEESQGVFSSSKKDPITLKIALQKDTLKNLQKKEWLPSSFEAPIECTAILNTLSFSGKDSNFIKELSCTGSFSTKQIGLKSPFKAFSKHTGSFTFNGKDEEITCTIAPITEQSDDSSVKLSIKGMKKSITIQTFLKNFPTEFIGSLSNSPELQAIIGEKLTGILDGTKSKDKNFATFELETEKAKAKGTVFFEKNTLSLQTPLEMQLRCDEETFKAISSEQNQIIGAGDKNNTIFLTIEPEGFLLHLLPGIVENLQIKKGILKLGKVRIADFPNITSLLSSKTKEKKDTSFSDLWTTPVYFSLNRGTVHCDRVDLLIDNTLHAAIWGSIQLHDGLLDLRLGLDKEVLEKTGAPFKKLPKGYMITFPVRGTLKKPKLDKGKLMSIITSLYLQNKKNRINGMLNSVFSNKEEDVPSPTTQPFPWEKK